jgi:hypothetical protein
LDVSHVLNRQTMSDAGLAHECYYSRSTVGAYLPRHMDERHEETKGPRGWILPSRRSVSWLIYLSDVDLVGGALRTFPQRDFHYVKPGILESGSHNGNLQVGWIDMKGRMGQSVTLPVYLDSWFSLPHSAGSGVMDPHCILYTIPLFDKEASTDVLYITKPWNNDPIQMATSDFLKLQAEIDGSSDTKEATLFGSKDYAKGFRLLEDRESWEFGPPANSIIEDITPKRGSLVMFDSVSVPHEVAKVEKNTRSALAGWFHEETQQFPYDLA